LAEHESAVLTDLFGMSKLWVIISFSLTFERGEGYQTHLMGRETAKYTSDP